MAERQKSLERALEDAVSRALRDNLAPLQRTADELHQAYADLVAACSSSRPSNALPAMLRAQTAASSLAAGLSVLSNFVAVALNPRDHHYAAETSGTGVAEEAEEAPAEPARARATSRHAQVAEPEPESAAPQEPASEWASESDSPAAVENIARPEPVAETAAEETVEAQSVAFDVANLSEELQDLHRRANRVAKVAMQDIKLLRPKDVRVGIEHKDLCHRLRSDIDKARKEYDRRFRAIQDHPVDYFHHWMVKILAEGDSEALGEYPYPSPVLRG
ncbi:MAG: hypothetical protein ACRD4M_12250 [Candidatus Acidiferrales bacterium]